MIFSADNPLSLYMQFYNKLTNQPIRNVLSYDTITGEGVVVGTTQPKPIPHLGIAQSQELSLDSKGELAKVYFKDERKNVKIVISIPETKYEEFGRYIYNDIQRAPEHNEKDSVKIVVNITKEYIDKSGADKNIRLR